MNRVISRGVLRRFSSHAGGVARHGGARCAPLAERVRAAATGWHRGGNGGAGKWQASSSRGFAAEESKPSAEAETAQQLKEEEQHEEQDDEERQHAQHEQRKRDDADEAHDVTQKLLSAAMKHVAAGSGWTDASLRAAAADLGYSPAVVGQLPRGKGSLVEHFVEECDSRLSVQVSMQHNELADMSGKERLVAVMQWRLAMLEPYIESWASAVAIQAAPENIPTTLRQRAMLADEMCAAAGPGLGLAHISHGGGFEMAAAGWYTDRAAVAALYSTCELFMLTDTSPNLDDTRAFVASRVAEISEAAKTIEEVGGFAAAASKGLPSMPAMSGLVPPGGREAMEGLFGKLASAVLKSGVEKK